MTTHQARQRIVPRPRPDAPLAIPLNAVIASVNTRDTCTITLRRAAWEEKIRKARAAGRLASFGRALYHLWTVEIPRDNAVRVRLLPARATHPATELAWPATV